MGGKAFPRAIPQSLRVPHQKSGGELTKSNVPSYSTSSHPSRLAHPSARKHSGVWKRTRRLNLLGNGLCASSAKYDCDAESRSKADCLLPSNDPWALPERALCAAAHGEPLLKRSEQYPAPSLTCLQLSTPNTASDL